MSVVFDQKGAVVGGVELHDSAAHLELRSPSPAPAKNLHGSLGVECDTEAHELPVLNTRTNSDVSVLQAQQQPKSESQIRKEVRTERIALAALVFSMFMEGWNDGTAGPLIPAMQRDYKVSTVLIVYVIYDNFL